MDRRGAAALAAGGPDAARIESLAQALGVTKGGFYGHVDNRGALLDAMLDRWERDITDEVIERVERGGGDAKARLRRLFAIAASGDGPGVTRQSPSVAATATTGGLTTCAHCSVLSSLTRRLMVAGNLDDAELVASGLAKTARTGRLIDVFRDRLDLNPRRTYGRDHERRARPQVAAPPQK